MKKQACSSCKKRKWTFKTNFTCLNCKRKSPENRKKAAQNRFEHETRLLNPKKLSDAKQKSKQQEKKK